MVHETFPALSTVTGYMFPALVLVTRELFSRAFHGSHVSIYADGFESILSLQAKSVVSVLKNVLIQLLGS